MSSCYESFKKYAVPAKDVADFLKRYTKPDRHEGRGREYVQDRIKSNQEHIEKYGYTFITHHDSKTGETVSFYPSSKVDLIKITQKQWDNIPSDYKGKWDRSIKELGWQPDLPEEYIGKRTVLSGCISNELHSLLTEGIHFEIIPNRRF